MKKEVNDFDYEFLRNETLKCIDLIKKSSNVEILKDKIVCLWRNISVPHLNKENDIIISNADYKHSEKTSLYLIIHYLIEKKYIDVLEEFRKEYKGKEDVYITDCIQRHLKYNKILSCMENGDFALFKNFMTNDNLSEDIKFYHEIHNFLSCSDEMEALKIMIKNISVHMPNKKEECKLFLKFLVESSSKDEAILNVKDILINLFKINFCKLNSITDEDYLSLLFDVGCSAFPQLLTMKGQKVDDEENMLPAEIKVEKGRNFHSLFICPVLKVLCTDENKPILLSCNHVISLDAANVLSKLGTISVFKCPYCPEMCIAKQNLPLEF